MDSNSSMKSLERAVSEKAMRLGSSFPCQICVVGFLCGVCLASLFLAALTSFGTFRLTDFPSSAVSSTHPLSNLLSRVDMAAASVDSETEEDRVNLLVTAWDQILKHDAGDEEAVFFEKLKLKRWMIPSAPHLEDCRTSSAMSRRLDTRLANDTSPFLPWTTWKGRLALLLDTDPTRQHPHLASSHGSYPPWIIGGDEDNYPLTRKMQSDIWIHQHPLECKNSSVRFLVADWERLPGFGIGAQIAGMAGLLAIAIKENRVLVTDYYNRADHDDCKGSSRSSWSCYFLLETSQECRERAFELKRKKEAWETGTLTAKHNYRSKEIWAGPTPRLWGEP